MRARHLLAGLAVLTLLAGSGCTGGEPAPAPSTPAPAPGSVDVVATTPVLADFLRVVGGNRVKVVTLLKPNVDPHEYEPSPADLDLIAKADLVVKNGVGLEPWIDDVVESSGYTGPVVDASRGATLRAGVVPDGGGEAPAGDGGEADRDPHIWHDPRNAKVMATNASRGLAQADPGGAAAYQANLAAFLAELDRLDAEIAEQWKGLPNRRLVTNHHAFGYYVDRYGLEFVGSVIPSLETTAEPSARELAALVARIRTTGVKAIFTESSLPPKAAEAIAREAGVKVVTGQDALYADTLGPPGSPAATYLGMMRHNTRTLVTNLR